MTRQFLREPRFVNLYIDGEVFEEFDAFALANRLNKSELIRILIKSFIELYDRGGELLTHKKDKREIAFYTEKADWEKFGEICEKLGMRKGRTLELLLRKVIHEQEGAQN